MSNWIDLSKIPQRKFGNKNVYDWKNSIGIACNFNYNKISGVLTIINYEPKKHILSVLYQDKIKNIKTDEFRACKIMTLIGLRTNDFRVDVGQEFIDEHRNLNILSRERTKDSNGRFWKMYKYHCNICGWDDGLILEKHLLNGVGCSCCSKHTIVPFINDVYTTNPELIKYFKYIEDTHKTTSCNKKRFIMVCPNCGNEQWYSTDDLMNHGFSCRKCSDGISYGEKFMYSFLKQLGINFVSQLTHTTFKWCGKYRYDFYIPHINTIIEVNGIQHYDNDRNPNDKFGRCLISDPIKEMLAKENNIFHYIHIDCSKSECEYIKNSVIQSGLLNILEIEKSQIDWSECDKFTSKSIVVETCNYKNQHPELSTKDIGDIFGMAGTTIQKYLQRGAELGICIYDKEFEKRCSSKEKRLSYYCKVA